MDERIGTIIGGKYRLEKELGAGGMGMVYAATQIGLNRKCAVKLLHESLSKDGMLVARLKREAEVAASMGHPNIVQVTDFGIDEGRAFLVMDLLRGMPLADAIQEGTLTPQRVRFIASQVLSALDAAHQREIVHRDLKPDNIYLTSLSGVSDVVKLLDFGIARMTSEESQKMTTTGQVLGTPAYMSPEQARGQEVDRRTDLYSLGVVMYEALSGHMPFDGSNYHELMFNIVGQTPTPLGEHRPDLPRGLLDVVAKAMAKNAADRYQTASEFSRDLDALGPIETRDSPAAVQIPSTRHDATTDADAFAKTVTPEAVMAIDTQQPDAVVAVPTQASVETTSPGMRAMWMGAGLVTLLAVAGGVYAFTRPEPELVAVNAPPTESEEVPNEEQARDLAKLMYEEMRRNEAHSEIGDEQSDREQNDDEQDDESSESESPEVTEMSTSMSAMSEMTMSSMSSMSAMSSADTNPLRKPARLARFPSEPHPPLPHRVGSRPWQDSYGNPIVWARCGDDYIKEVYPVLPDTELEFSSFAGNNVVALDQLRPFFRNHLPEVTRCFRGHTLNRGQRVVLTIDAEGNVTDVDLPRYCPIPASVRTCVSNVYSGQRVAPDRAAPGQVHGGLDVDGA